MSIHPVYGVRRARRLEGRQTLAANSAPLVPTGGTRAEELDEAGKARAHVTEVPTGPWVTRAQDPQGLPVSGGFLGVAEAWDTYPERQRWGGRGWLLTLLHELDASRPALFSTN